MAEEIRGLRQHRMARGYTIRDLAAHAGVSTQTIVSIEKGNAARIQSYRKIAEALDVELMAISEYRALVDRAGEDD